MARKTKQDWFFSALNILAETGSNGLTIEALTSRLGVTKGSFYHHFGGYQQFKQQLLGFFEEAGTLDLIARSEQGDSAQAKLRRLMQIIVEETKRHPAAVEIAVRMWALQDDEVYAFLQQIDQQRLDYVESLCLQITGDAAKARLMAEMMYAILIGSEQMLPPIHQTRLQLLFDEYLRLFAI